MILQTVKLREALSHGISIFEYDSNRIGTKAYRELMALKRSILANNRLAQGIFSKTELEEESSIKNQESLFLIDGKKVTESTGRLLRKYGFKLRSNYFELC